MNLATEFFANVPYIALFTAIMVGVWIGKPSFKGISLGSVGGTLVAAVAIGQWHFSIPGPFKDIMFALFIYSIGYVAGPSFIHAFSRKAWRQIVQATFIAAIALLTVFLCAYVARINLGTAAGLASGALTQSAIIGTAGSAIQALQVSAADKTALVNNVTIAYAITYLFGTLGAILLITYVSPLIARQSLSAGAKEIEDRLNGGQTVAAGEFLELPPSVARAYQISAANQGKLSAAERAIGPDVAILRLVRGTTIVDISTDPVLQSGDQVLVVGKRDELFKNAGSVLGSEITSLAGQAALGESLDVVVTNRSLNHKTIAELPREMPKASFHGIHLVSITRSGQKVPLLPGTEVHTGDTIRMVGLSGDVERLGRSLGYIEKPSDSTDYVWLGLGIIAGILLGMVHVPIGVGVVLSLGTGGGCMFSGLIFGYLRSLHPTFGRLPSSSADFLKNFGLIAFIAVVGLEAGPKALQTIEQHGWTLVYLGAIVTTVPIIAAQLLAAYVLRGDLKNSQLMAGSIAGGRSCTAALGSVMSVSNSNVAMQTYPVTYTLAQIYLTLLGPIIVSVMATWGPWATTLPTH
jgi:putative transport protein